jgi:selenocysteine lyase/cysteine desulfurase
MPDFLPDRLEAGTQNVCGAAGLLEGVRFVADRGPACIQAHECGLAQQMADLLEGVPGLRLFRGRQAQSGVLSLTIRGLDCEEVGETLGRRGVAVRAGLHCAPLAHRTAGTLDTGTVRLSVSAFNNAEEVARVAEILREVAAGAPEQ